MTTTQTEAKKSNKKANGTASRKNSIGGFFIDKVDGDVMKAYVSSNDLEETIDCEDTTDEQIAVSLALHFKETVGEDDQVRCEVCEGISAATEKACPFCGDTTEVEGADASDANEPEDSEPEIEVAAASSPEVDSDDDEEEADEEEEEEEEIEAADEDEEEEEPKAAKPAKVVPIKTKTKTAESKETMTTTQMNGSAKTQKLVKVVKAPKAELVTANDLDRAIEEVVELKSAGAEAYWNLGKKLLEINVKQLWKLRLNDKGKAKYKGFDAFVHNELNMTPQHAYTAIECAKGYETPEEVRELGHTKASLLLKAAPEDRAKLKAKAKAGATAKQLKKDVKESRAKDKTPKTGKAAAGAKGAAAKAAAHPQEKISIATIVGAKTIKLFAKPESMKGLDFSTLQRATKVQQTPFGRFEMANGVCQYFSVLMKEGALVLKIETRREATSE